MATPNFAVALAGVDDEAVEVNQRALIDKVLARYSGEYTVFRELLQNADDACAKTVEIRFLTAPTATLHSNPSLSDATPVSGPPSDGSQLPDLAKTPIHTIQVINDGIPFRPQDWARLRKIAEGNPDETKIGAFGVGFYSLWSISDEPVVVSGDTVMGFRWSDRNSDQLVTRRAPNPAAVNGKAVGKEGKEWTTFVIPVREPSPMPPPKSFAQFLATSLAFTASLQCLRLYLDGILLCELKKETGSHTPLRGFGTTGNAFGRSGSRDMMFIRRIEEARVKIHINVKHAVVYVPPNTSKKLAAAVTSLTLSNAKTTGAPTSLAAKMLSVFSSRSQALPTSSPAPPTPSPDPSPPSVDLLQELGASLHLRIVTAKVGVKLDPTFEREIERATKKKPPRETEVALLWRGFDDLEASSVDYSLPLVNPSDTGPDGAVAAKGDPLAKSIFDNLLPPSDSPSHQQGRIFIAFQTHQTTGASFPLAARFIPTVERESLDFQAAYVSGWNKEVLRIGGKVGRAVWESEMAGLAERWKIRSKPLGVDEPESEEAKEEKARLQKAALHVMRSFEFHESTPSATVSSELERSFFMPLADNSLAIGFSISGWTMHGDAGQNRDGAGILVASTQGPKPAYLVRLVNPDLTAFIKNVPLLLDDVPPALVMLFKDRGWIRDVGFDDVFDELGSRALNVQEMKACLAWFVGLTKLRGYEPSLVSQLKSTAVFEYKILPPTGQNVEQVVPLATARTFVSPGMVPFKCPLPAHTLPFELTKSLRGHDLINVFGWAELSISSWLEHLLSPECTGEAADSATNLLASPTFAETVLNVLVKFWAGLTAKEQDDIKKLLEDKKWVPTRKGMKKPGDAYHANVTLFEDLAVIQLASGQAVKAGSPSERVLTALGVRKHIELQMVFSLLGKGDWSHTDLIKYLVSVRDTLTPHELDRLRNTKFLPREGDPPPPPGQRPTRFSSGELYEPLDSLRSLGLPILYWPTKTKWRAGSEESRLLSTLGLKKVPALGDVLRLAAETSDAQRQQQALRQFLDHYVSAGYHDLYKPDEKTPPFVPCDLPSGEKGFAKPGEVVADRGAVVLGFKTLREEYLTEAVKFKVKMTPSPSELMRKVAEVVQAAPDKAQAVFGYMSSKTDLSDLKTLRRANIIPVKSATGSYSFIAPTECFFEGDDSSLPAQVRSLFTYVDFGTAAKPFLAAIGVRSHPTTQELAERVLIDPLGFYNRAGSAEQYTNVLRTLAANMALLQSSTLAKLREVSFFLGARRAAKKKKDAEAVELAEPSLLDDDDEETPYLHLLAKPRDIVVIDDSHSHALFADVVLACPQEEVLEVFAESLGARRLTRLIHERYAPEGIRPEQTERTLELTRSVVERTSLFLHERQQYQKSEVRHDAEWLKGHLAVREVANLTLHRRLEYKGSHANVQRASATAILQSGQVILYCTAGEPDWWDVSLALCKILLAKQRLNDTLLFSTILATSLKNLKRRGMNVDRIMNARKAEKAAAEQRERERRLQLEAEAAEALTPERLEQLSTQLEEAFPDADPAHIRQTLASQKENHLARAGQQLLGGYPKKPSQPSSRASISIPSPPPEEASQGGGLFNSFKRRLANTGSSSLTKPPWTKDASPGTMTGALGSSAAPEPPNPAQPRGVHPESEGPTVLPNPSAKTTPQSDIKSNLVKAISASRPDNNLNLHGKSQTKPVKESESSYCDPSGAETALTFVTNIGGMRFYVSRQVPGDPSVVIEQFGDPIQRYAEIIRPVGDVFDLDPRSLHMFYDLDGPLIAFNRSGSIFLNLRYYMAWYDDRVKQGDKADALIGTFSSIAHELAHNLVLSHNSEHEWWMSAFIENYFLRLAQYIGRTQSAAGRASAIA